MHEVSLVQSLFTEVRRALEGHPGAVVKVLHVRIGELAGVEPELLRRAYDALRETAGFPEAELWLVDEAAVWTCPLCGGELVRGAPLACTTCELPARLFRGGEMFLDRIEAVMNDV